MSKDIIIQENGVSQNLIGIERVRTNAVNGDTVDWLPEDECTLGTINIKSNGTYKAEDNGVYGFSKAVIDVPLTQITGKGSDGNDYSVTVDDDGNIVETKVPSSIKVVTPPTNEYGIYVDGQTITKDGMIIKAYYADGTEWGTVPNDEVTIDPTKAVYDESTDTGVYYTDGNGVNVKIYYTGRTAQRVGAWGKFYVGDYVGKCISGQFEGKSVYLGEYTDTSGNHYVYATQYNGYMYMRLIDTSQGNANINDIYVNEKGPFVNGARSLLRDTKWSKHYIPSIDYIYPKSTTDPTNMGDLSPVQQAGSHQTINVSWPRPNDGKLLTTTFEVLVAPSPSGDDDK